MTHDSLGFRGTLAHWGCSLASWASRRLKRGNGGMIGGLVALTIDPHIMRKLAAGRPTILVTGTNGKSTTTRMVVQALRTHCTVATNEGGDNMDAGIVSALNAHRNTDMAVLEVDEMHVPHVMDNVHPIAVVLLNLSRDQLDRVGEINTIEHRLRTAMSKHPETTLIANCDDVMMTSVAFDAPHVMWIGTGNTWKSDATTSPRNHAIIVHSPDDWYATAPLSDGREFRRPTPELWVDDEGIHTMHHDVFPLNLRVPGNANRGNAAQAIAAAEVAGIEIHSAIDGVENVTDVAGRYRRITWGKYHLRLLLAKNPAGWHEALTMIDTTSPVVIAVNGQDADGVDLSWLWDVEFERFRDATVVCAGERGTDLSVRLSYADVPHRLIHTVVDAIQSCPPGNVEILANYTAFRDLYREVQ